MKQQPSRILNEPSNVMGLVGSDILALSAIFMVSQKLLFYFGLEVIAIVIALISSIMLSIIRMRFRRRIIRDAIFYYSRKIFFLGILYVR